MTQETKHTPAPWVISNDSSAYMDGIIVTDKKGENEVAGVWEMDDANLIAAAPELLEALECMEIAGCGVAIHHAGERKLMQDAVGMARKAIAKAEGK